MYRVAARRATTSASASSAVRANFSTSRRALQLSKPPTHPTQNLSGEVAAILSALGAKEPPASKAPLSPSAAAAAAAAAAAGGANAGASPSPIRPKRGIILDKGDNTAEETPVAPPPVADLDAARLEERRGGLQRVLYNLYVRAGRNNTMLTLTDESGRVCKSGWVSSGLCHFRKANRASYEAAYQCAVTMFRRVEYEQQLINSANPNDFLALILKMDGYGPGRDAVSRALLTQEGSKVAKMISFVMDTTPIKIGGTRAKKMRRL